MSIIDTAYRVVMGCRGGIVAMAARMGKSEKVLGNKLNPNCDTHHLNIEELEMIVGFADTDEIAKYFCAQRGGVFLKSEPLDEVSDESLVDLLMERDEGNGRFAKAFRKAYEDGEIDDNEYADLVRKHDQVTAVREQIKLRLKSIYEQGRSRKQRLKIKSTGQEVL
ncbi:hypothetical protein SAMN05216302_101455 [Nitrosomonas aestuarii]|uniref:Phage regulatory protein CII (CP76) n=1 Tax=Nitrosomonas aestuarii TaxID=52441 RepID=A0A1I4C1L6_9PROT|nr:phage regulatory CII family protein [Nitrosomonas aestuarii]SFK74994.1 hypothetical protein SAMN05216302_101455 [Nitrosomonas aestuarii]